MMILREFEREAKAVTMIIAAGGTGGHIFPALAVAELLCSKGANIIWIGSGGMETQMVRDRALPLHIVPFKPARPLDKLKLIPAVWKAYRLLRLLNPDVVLGMGGYASVPTGLAAWLCGIPLIVHEQNARPGRANRLLARFAYAVLSGFPGVPGATCHVGNPVRREFRTPRPRSRPSRGECRHFLILGGSQGARALNHVVPETMALLQKRRGDLKIIHQCGAGHLEETQARYQAAAVDAEVREFMYDVADRMKAADIVICRAGAATLAELAVTGVGAILVPYPHAAADHQTANARYYQEQGAAILCRQDKMTAAHLESLLLAADAAVLAEKMRSLAKPFALEWLASRCVAAGTDFRLGRIKPGRRGKRRRHAS